MTKYRVIGVMSASIEVGVYEADTEEAAIAAAEEDREANWQPSLCHHCSHKVDLGDVYETIAEEAE